MPVSNLALHAKNIKAQKPLIKRNDPISKLKKVLWLYILLLVFEGALRKWVLPFLSGPLLIVRDPVALYILFLAGQQKIVYKSAYIAWMVAVGFIGILTAMVMGHHDFAVALYGARIYVLHFPVIFVMGKVFNKKDVIQVGRFFVYSAIPIAVLIALQFKSPQSAFVNRGVGGDEAGAGFAGAMGYMRPPGTFSFTNGNTLYFQLVTCFIFYFWLYQNEIKRIVLLLGTGALLMAIPLSISRALFFFVAVCAGFTLVAVARKPKYASKIIGAAIGISVLAIIIAKTSLFGTALDAFLARFNGANEAEGGVESVFLDRYLGGLINSLGFAEGNSIFGKGIGYGTSLGAQRLGPSFTEGEWGRIIFEQGPIFGMIIIIVRVAFSFDIFFKSFKMLKKEEFLPWILFSFLLLNVPQAQWKQPTALGFSVVIGGLVLAAFRVPKLVKPRIAPKNVSPIS
ncbi:hypothetical protein [Mucilaginibacter lacusdianchii]|uniref:hypothetical protein n=1 Tax=Mucilaginibacter lacusdianchii TaxID=2684211 RepID=UPI00131BE030|nr:hypothetical protein [Mucilaginibacter sp. JXJ CY 39]